MDTFKVTIRMFMEFGLINQFQIPYKVRKELNALLFNLKASLWKMTWLSTEMRSSSVNGKFVQRRPSIKIQNARLKTRSWSLLLFSEHGRGKVSFLRRNCSIFCEGNCKFESCQTFHDFIRLLRLFPLFVLVKPTWTPVFFLSPFSQDRNGVKTLKDH